MSILLNPDTSWLLTVAEQLLSGKTYGLDIMESNPPASALLYIPAVLFAKLTDITSETATVIYVLDLAALSWLFLSHLFRRRAVLSPKAFPAFFFGLAFFTDVFPFGHFAQKEHVVLLLTLPYLGLAAVNTEDGRPAFPQKLAAGLGLGLALCVKPHFVLVPAFITVATCLRRRRFSGFFNVEHAVAALIVLAYAALLLTLFSYYTSTVLPLTVEGYALLRKPFAELLLGPGGAFYDGVYVPVLLAVVVALRLHYGANPVQTVFLLAGCGFYAAFLAQGRGYSYQLYPATACLFLAVCSGFSPAKPMWIVTRLAAVGAFLYLGLLFSLIPILGVGLDLLVTYPGEIATLSALKPQPDMLCLCTSPDTGFPDVRGAGGHWVGRYSHSWAAQAMTPQQVDEIARGTLDAPQVRLTLQQIGDTAADILENRPDLILLENHPQFVTLVLNQADATRALADYEEATRLERPQGQIIVYRLKSPAFGG
ncbi:MAG: hypothetical protein LBR29_08920 [Methylobacteriaceae bacterium]|jgi:hypothetical protein|nr:hypothetical protein [Methylobacteriaceae bacterium]